MKLHQRFHKLFPDHAPDEDVIFFTRKHWFSFFIVFLIIFLMLIIPFIFVTISVHYFPHFFSGAIINIVVIISSMYILFLAASFLLSFINLYFDITILTNKRIIDVNQKGLFNREIDELDLLHVEDVSSKTRGIFSTLFDFGKIEIQTAGETRNFIFDAVPHPRLLAQKIQDQYKKLLEEEAPESLAKIDKAEGLGERMKHKVNKIGENVMPEQVEPEQTPEKPEIQPTPPQLSQEGDLSEGKMVDFSEFSPQPAPEQKPSITSDNEQILIKFNAPKNSKDDILKILPSLKSPTINELANPEFIAVESVIKKSDIEELIPKLKNFGAQDIIESDIKIL